MTANLSAGQVHRRSLTHIGESVRLGLAAKQMEGASRPHGNMLLFALSALAVKAIDTRLRMHDKSCA